MDKEQFEQYLSSTSGPFKSKLERIRRYLYLGKASVMVGAGFSRNADFPPHLEIKQWNDVGKDIYCRLQNVKEPVIDDLVFKTPMRLASQFAASFGRSELDNLIKESIPDGCMYPGSLHKQLLSLPWRDVFTTNYDTLLERGSEGLERSYSVITSKEMLLYKGSPRIVKLHGSFPDKTPFLMTEEDFRTYPVDHPEFVNTVRQALVESIFCLVGFSGDDPNFTSWMGWLHDVMGDYAGPSYLVTCNENYDESFKVLMEHRGVDVLNFNEIEGIHDHKTALDFFFTYLGWQTSEWNGRVNYNARELDAESLIRRFKKIRHSYPGWFVLPKKYYDQFSDMEHTFPNLEHQFKKLDVRVKESFLNELDWRADLSLTFKDFDWYREGIEEVVCSYGDTPMSEEAINIGLSLLKLYRYHPDKNDDYNTLKIRLKDELVRMTSYQANRFHYIVSSNALSILDFELVEKELVIWHPSSSCYEGVIYKSLVLAESGNVVSAVKLLEQSYERITHSLSQKESIKELSLRHAIESLLAFYHHEQMPNSNGQFSFLDVRDYFLSKNYETGSERFEITHGYGVGSESRSWNLGGGINPNLLYPYRCLSLYEVYGMPFSYSECPVDEKVFSQILPKLAEFGIGYVIGVVLRCVSRNVTVGSVNRTVLSSLSRDNADRLASILLSKSNYASLTKDHTRRGSEVLSPLLCRLASLCSQNIIVSIFTCVHSIYRKSANCKREDLKLLYSSVFPESVQEIYREVFSSEIYSDIHGNDIPLPTIGYNFYAPGRNEITIACNGLRSEQNKYRESAYRRAVCLLHSKIDSVGKEEIEGAIRLWRMTEVNSELTRHSYVLVKCVEGEDAKFKQLLSEDQKRIVEGDYSFNGSSVTISSLAEDLHNITLLSSSLERTVISEIFDKMSEVLMTNLDVYSNDDSSELMGGLRHFTVEVFEYLEEFVEAVCRKGYNEKEPCKKLFDVLSKYVSSHLPVRETMVELNAAVHLIGNKQMRDILTKDLFSENRSDVIDSCAALIFFAENSNNIQKVLQSMIFYCNHAETDKMRLYIQTLGLIPYSRITQMTRKLLSVMMNQVLENIPGQGFKEEQKVDIMHDGVKLAASLKNVHDDLDVEAAVASWQKYIESEAEFNDVRQPWYI